MPRFAVPATLAVAALFLGISPTSTAQPAPAMAIGPTYADLADLATAAPLVARVQVRDAARLNPAQAVGVRPGMARVFIKARTRALLSGEPVGESLRYLVDVPLDAKGKLPKLEKREALVFARPVSGRPGELQLVTPDAQIPWTPETEGSVRAILGELLAPGAPPAIAGVREALHVPGNLLGEGETQIFLSTRSGDPVSISVLRRPNLAPAWGVAFGEIVDQAARPPARETLAWYRLACFLPPALPAAAILSGQGEARLRAAEDYRFVRTELGACPRNRARR